MAGRGPLEGEERGAAELGEEFGVRCSSPVFPRNTILIISQRKSQEEIGRRKSKKGGEEGATMAGRSQEADDQEKLEVYCNSFSPGGQHFDSVT